MAPEVPRGKPYNFQGTGILLFELLTGQEVEFVIIYEGYVYSVYFSYLNTSAGGVDRFSYLMNLISESLVVFLSNYSLLFI